MKDSPYSYFLSPSWRGKTYLLSPFLDFIMGGGGAVAVLAFFTLLLPYTNSITTTVVTTLVFGLAYVVNWPHFMVSYQLLYTGYSGKIRPPTPYHMRWHYRITGIIVPLLLAAGLSYSIYEKVTYDSTWWASYALALMYFTVGWHYAKQAFGVFMMLSALRSTYFSTWQRRILLGNGYIIWFWSFGYPKPTTSGLFLPQVTFIHYPNAIFPPELALASLIAAAASSVAVIYVLAHAWLVEHKRPPLSALIGYLSMYYLLAFVGWLHPLWVLVAPFFHSLQYLLFVGAYRRGHFRKSLDALPEPDPEEKGLKEARNRHDRFYAFSFLLGLIFFFLLPATLDWGLHAADATWPIGFMTVIFLIFINVHHYFIDSVIWRKENREVGEYLFTWSRKG